MKKKEEEDMVKKRKEGEANADVGRCMGTVVGIFKKIAWRKIISINRQQKLVKNEIGR